MLWNLQRMMIVSLAKLLKPGMVIFSKLILKRTSCSPEMNFPEGFVHHTTKYFGKPVVDSSKYGDDGDGEKGVMKMCEYKISVVQIYILGTGSKINAGDPAEKEFGEKGERKKHGRF